MLRTCAPRNGLTFTLNLERLPCLRKFSRICQLFTFLMMLSPAIRIAGRLGLLGCRADWGRGGSVWFSGRRLGWNEDRIGLGVEGLSGDASCCLMTLHIAAMSLSSSPIAAASGAKLFRSGTGDVVRPTPVVVHTAAAVVGSPTDLGGPAVERTADADADGVFDTAVDAGIAVGVDTATDAGTDDVSGIATGAFTPDSGWGCRTDCVEISCCIISYCLFIVFSSDIMRSCRLPIYSCS